MFEWGATLEERQDTQCVVSFVNVSARVPEQHYIRHTAYGIPFSFASSSSGRGMEAGKSSLTTDMHFRKFSMSCFKLDVGESV